MSANKEFSELFKIAYSSPEIYLNFIKNAYHSTEDEDLKLRQNSDLRVRDYANSDRTIKTYVETLLNAEEKEVEKLGRNLETVIQGKIEDELSNKHNVDTMKTIRQAVSRYVKELVEKARSKSTTASFNENMSVLHNALAEEFSKKTASADKRKYAQVFDLLSQKDINEHLRRKYAEAQNRPFLVTVTCTTVKHEDAEHGEIPYGKRDAQVQEELSEECADLEELEECLQDISRNDKYKGWSSGDIQITPSSVSIDLVDPEPGEAHSITCNVHVTCSQVSCTEVADMVSNFFA